MVRPLLKDEQSELDKLFGATDSNAPMGASSGGVFGTSGGALSAATQDGKFTGETAGTGFVNANQYMDANKGKGSALGEQITAGASGLADNLTSGLDDFKKMDPGTFSADSPEDKAANDTMAWDSTKGGKKTSKDFGDAEAYFASKKGGYKSLAGDLDAKYGALQGLKGMGDDWKRKLDPNSSDARVTRSGLLKDSAKSQGLHGYNDNAQAFDSMFMEAESPDLISKKYGALESALSGFSGVDSLLAEKKAKDSQKATDYENYYTDKADKARARKDATWEREQRLDLKPDRAGDLIPGEAKTSTSEVNSSNTPGYKDPLFGGGTAQVQTTTHPDGTVETYNEFDKSRTTTYPDGSKKVESADGIVVEYNPDGSIKSAAGGFT